MRLTLKAVAFLAVMAIAAPVAAQTLRVTAATTNLRAKPAAEAEIVATLTKGAELEVIGKDGAWYRVRVKPSGAEGFVHSLVVETIAAAAPPGGAPATPTTPPSQPAPPTRPTPGTGPASQPVATSAPTERRYFIRLHGGLFSGFVNTGPGFGGGIAGRPFDNERIEIQGDFSYARLGQWGYRDFFGSEELTLTLYQGSGNFLYNFVLSDPKFTPFAGAGLVYSNTRLTYKGTTTLPFDVGVIEETAGVSFVSGLHLQLVGGLQWPINDRTAFRAELRAGFPGVLLLGGLSF